MNGIAYVKNLFAERLTVGTPEKPAGITLYDEATGSPYCVKVVNGAMVSVAGECPSTSSGQVTATSTTPEITPVGPTTPEPTATSTEPVATTTPPIATSTPPVIETPPTETTPPAEPATTTAP